MMRPDEASSEMAYAVHTETCTYLLDEGGVCRWIVSRRGVVPPHVQQCIGAQFVACLDLSVDGDLLGDLAQHAHALFVKHTGSHMIMLRTGPIEHVDDRRHPGASEGQPPPAAAMTHGMNQQYGKRGGVPDPRGPDPGGPDPGGLDSSGQAQPPSFGVVEHSGAEATVTVSLSHPGAGPPRSK